MKSIKYLAVVVLTVLLIGCKEEIVNPVIPEPPQDQLDNRSKDLFIEGNDITEALKTLINEFDLSDTVLLKSLYAAGYDKSDIAEAVCIVLLYNARSAEPILMDVLSDETKAQIAELILKEYFPELKVNREDLKYFIAMLPDIVKKIAILKEKYDRSPEEIVSLLKEMGEDIVTTIKNIEKTFLLNEVQVKELLLKLNLSVKEIVEVLRQLYNYTAEAVFEFLYNNGYQVVDICKALMEKYDDLKIDRIYEMLKSIYGDDLDKILVTLKQIGYGYEKIGALLDQYYNFDKQEIAGYLKDIGATAGEIVNFLKNHYQNLISDEQIAQILKEINFDLENIFFALQDQLKLAQQHIIDILTSLGFDLCDILKIIKLPCF